MSTQARIIAEQIRACQSYCDQGRLFLAAGELRRALRAYQLACLVAPLERGAWIGIACCQQRLDEPEAALAALVMAQSLGADHPGLALQQAECELRLGRRDMAILLLRDVLDRASTQGEAVVEARAKRMLDGLQP